MFNIHSFINNAPSLDRNFYEQFFRTKIFFHFIKRKIFPMSIVDKLEVWELIVVPFNKIGLVVLTPL